MKLSILEIKESIDTVSAVLDVYLQIAAMPSCNTCRKVDCEYRPKDGEKMRLNCPLWEGGNNG